MKFVAARPCLHASTAAALERHCHGAPRAPLHAVWAGGRWPAMEKCYKCTSAQASYYDPDNGPGRYCKQCAKTVPGAVSRWQKDKQKAAAAATEAAAALATVGGACSSIGSDTRKPTGKGKSNGKRTRTGLSLQPTTGSVVVGPTRTGAGRKGERLLGGSGSARRGAVALMCYITHHLRGNSG